MRFDRPLVGTFQRLAPAFVTGIVAVVGCGGKTTLESVSDAVDPAVYFDTLASVLYRHLVECGLVGASEVEARKARLVRSLASSRPGRFTIGESVAAGRLRISATALDACTRPRSSSCIILEISCPGSLVGLVPIGGACDSSHECANGFCSPKAGCSGSVCKPFNAIGEPCDDHCAPSDFCDAVSGTCQPRQGLGSVCMFGGCVEGLSCTAAATDSRRTCSTPLADGEACSAFSTPCGVSLYCQFATGATEGICRPKLDPGASCDGSNCRGAFSCTGPADGRSCVPWGDVGTPCGAFDPDVCPKSMTCDATRRTCVLPPRFAEGDPCTSTCEPSDAQIYCEAQSQTCRRVPDLGESCSVAADAGFSATAPCRTGVCDPTTGTCVFECR